MRKVFGRGPALLMVVVLVVVTACARTGPAGQDQRIAGQELAADAPAQAAPDFAGRAVAAGKDQRIARQELAPVPLTLPSAGSAASSDAEDGPANMRTAESSPGVSVAANAASAASAAGAASARPTGVEPNAGSWKTFLLTSGSQFRPAAPPNKLATRDEIDHLQSLVAQRAAAARQIAYWNDGGPVYRWDQIAVEELLAHNANVMMAERALALVHAAAYDAVIAAWDAKYTYNRPRPSDFDHRITTVLPNPDSPSYPSDYAAVASASSAVLAYLFPDRAQALAEKAAAAGQSRLLAGVEYLSDVEVGSALGRQIAALAIARGQSDGSTIPWTGTVPAEPGKWSGTNPALPGMGTWKTWVLSSGSEFRPGPPPAYDSPEKAAELLELTTLQRTPKQAADGFFWEYGAGGLRSYWLWNQKLSELVLAHDLAANPPRAARSYVLANVAAYDALVGCWDAKYTYWAARPFQLDPNFKPLFPTPNHPSYPAAHGCISTAFGDTLAYLFAADAQAIHALADNAGQSRIWAGIHFRSDVDAGQALGAAVAQKVIQQAEADGSN